MAGATIFEALEAVHARRPGGARVYAGGCSGAPLGLACALRARPELAGGLTFLGVWIPGVNRTDWAGLHPDARAETIFLPPDLRPSFEAGRTAFRPLAYTQAWSWLQTTPLDAAFVVTSPPDAAGRLSLGVSADFAGAVLDRPKALKIALVNPHTPRAADSPAIEAGLFDLLVDDDAPLAGAEPAALPPAFASLAQHVAALIEDGDTLQFGLGNVQQAVLEALTDRRGLKLHSGMVSDPLLGLIDAGALDEAPGAVTTGVAIGSPALYDHAARDPRFRFRPVAFTHALKTLAAVPSLKAVNSVIEVDLFGQANAEFIGGRQVSGAGGLVDFLRGAAASPGGRGIAALVSTAKRGAVSRIVPRLAPNAVTVARADLDTVVTEHGVADLRGQTLDERAEALISIADPAHQAELASAWAAMRSAM